VTFTSLYKVKVNATSTTVHLFLKLCPICTILTLLFPTPHTFKNKVTITIKPPGSTRNNLHAPYRARLIFHVSLMACVFEFCDCLSSRQQNMFSQITTCIITKTEHFLITINCSATIALNILKDTYNQHSQIGF